jgi:hypothetical protein
LQSQILHVDFPATRFLPAPIPYTSIFYVVLHSSAEKKAPDLPQITRRRLSAFRNPQNTQTPEKKPK